MHYNFPIAVVATNKQLENYSASVGFIHKQGINEVPCSPFSPLSFHFSRSKPDIFLCTLFYCLTNKTTSQHLIILSYFLILNLSDTREEDNTLCGPKCLQAFTITNLHLISLHRIAIHNIWNVISLGYLAVMTANFTSAYFWDSQCPIKRQFATPKCV